MQQQTLNTIKKEFSVILALLTSYLALNPAKKNLLLTIQEEISKFIESEEDTLKTLMAFLLECVETNSEYPFLLHFLEELDNILYRNEEFEKENWKELFPDMILGSFLNNMLPGLIVHLTNIPNFKTQDGFDNWLEELKGGKL